MWVAPLEVSSKSPKNFCPLSKIPRIQQLTYRQLEPLAGLIITDKHIRAKIKNEQQKKVCMSKAPEMSDRNKPILNLFAKPKIQEHTNSTTRSRQLRLGGKEVKMFLTVGATEEDLRKTLNSMEFSFVEVDKARDTAQDIKGPYCETSPLLPYVRRIQLRAPYTKAIEMKITDLMCRQGVTLSHLDQYRSGKDIIMEGIAHMPTGVAEFPKLDEVVFVQSLEKQGILVKQFSKIVGNPAPIGK